MFAGYQKMMTLVYRSYWKKDSDWFQGILVIKLIKFCFFIYVIFFYCVEMLTLSFVYKISVLLSIVSTGCSFSKRCFEKFEVRLLLANASEFLLNRTQYFHQVYVVYHFLHFNKVNW